MKMVLMSSWMLVHYEFRLAWSELQDVHGQVWRDYDACNLASGGISHAFVLS